VIVISGALVLVALVLLVIGLIDPSLTFVYASIGVSLASFVFLVVGILQRRKQDVPGAEEATTGGAALAEASSETAASGVTTLLPVAKQSAASGSASGSVLVVAGRPRYHVDGCRYLTGKVADPLPVEDARDQGFTACGVCKPDDNLVSTALTETAPTDAATEQPEEAPAPAARVARAAAKPAAKASPKAAAKAAPKTAKAATRASAAAPARKAAAKAAPAKKALTPAKPPVKAPVKRGGVIVIPDRGKFHTADCRYVRGAEETLELTKAAATRQGYEACGVCSP